MAQMAITVGGGILGSFVGMPQLGLMLGAVAGQLLFPAHGPTMKGPRLSDLAVMSSAYGQSIPICFGTDAISGNVIWSTGIKEKRKRKGGGKGMGGGGSAMVTYTYSASFAVGLAEGPAADVLRIWFDDKLVFDKTGNSGNIAKPGLNFRFYRGDETQLPDPAIVADKGQGNTPAYRGLAYIVFENLPLAAYGNRIPNVRCEIAFAKSSSQPYNVFQGSPDSFGNTFSQSSIGIDYARNVGYAWTASGGLRRFNLDTMVEDRWITAAAMANGAATSNYASILFYVAPDGFIYLSADGASNSQPVAKIDPETLIEVGRAGRTTSGLSFGSQDLVSSPKAGMVQIYGINSVKNYLILGGLFGGSAIVRTQDMKIVWWENATLAWACFVPRPGVMGDCYGVSAAGKIYRYRIQPGATYYEPVSPDTQGSFSGLTQVLVDTLTAAMIDPAATGFNAPSNAMQAGWYDSTDDSIILQANLVLPGAVNQGYTFKWREGVGVVWATKVPTILQTNNAMPTSRLARGKVAWRSATAAYEIDTVSGALTQTTWSANQAQTAAQIYDSVSDSVLSWMTTKGWTREYLNRGSGLGVSLSSIVQSICARVGLAAANLDTSALTDTVAGYIIGRQMKAADALEPLAQAFFFDAVESDYKLKFVKRGGASLITIPQRDMGYVTNDDDRAEFLQDRIGQEMELPRAVTVGYFDKARDYQQGGQEVRRTSSPSPTMRSSNNASYELPIVMTADQARQTAEKLLFAAWTQRNSLTHRLPWTYMWLDPADVVTMSYDDGSSVMERLTKIDMGVNFELAIEGASEDQAAYGSTILADPGSWIPQTVPGAYFSRLFVLDIPLLRDQDDTGGSSSCTYLTASGYGAGRWPGCAAMRSADNGITFDDVAELVSPATWGACMTALPDTDQPFSWDVTTALRISLNNRGDDPISSVSDLEVLNGANAAVVIRSDGAAEIIQFANATLNADGTYTLSRLLRGRRGTEVFTGGHQTGDAFVLLTAGDLDRYLMPLSERGQSRQWKGVGFGQAEEDAPTIISVGNASDLKPYAPVHIKAAIAGSDIALSWVRRTRLGGELMDGAGNVPLGEASEAYEVDILAGPGGAVKRTLTGLSAPSATYLAANITTDFGSMPASLTLRVYQISAAVGRGFTKETTVGVS